jgi:hypothetical protein
MYSLFVDMLLFHRCVPKVHCDMLFDTGCIWQVVFCSEKLHNNFKIVTSLQNAFSRRMQHCSF